MSHAPGTSDHHLLPEPAAIAAHLAHTALDLSGPLLAAWARGRVNLIGEHTDYNEGFVLPIAIERVVALAGKLGTDPDDSTVRLYSALYDERTSFRLDALPSALEPRGQPLWARYVAGALVEIATESPGGAYGARVVGAGFGGGVLIVAPESELERLSRRIAARYPARTGRQPEIARIRPAGGSGCMEIGEVGAGHGGE